VLWSAVLGAGASHWHVTQNVATNSALQPGAHPLAAGGQCQIRFSRGDSLAITARSLARSLVISSRPRRVRRNLNLHYARTQVRSSGRSLWHLVRLAVGVKVVLVRPLYIFYAESLREYTGRVRMTSPRRRLGTGDPTNAAHNNTVDHLWYQGDADPNNGCAKYACVADKATIFKAPHPGAMGSFSRPPYSTIF
jgi:hypothetical protein